MTAEGVRNIRHLRDAAETLIAKVDELTKQRNDAMIAADRYRQQAKDARLALSYLTEEKPPEFDSQSFWVGAGVGSGSAALLGVGLLFLLGGI